MINEDRKMLAAVQRERERIAVGVEMIAHALRKEGAIIFVGAGTSGRLGILESREMPPTFSTDPSWCRRSWPAAATRSSPRRKASRTTTKKARARSRGCADQEGRRHRRLGERHDAVRARRADARAQRGARIIFVTCDPGTELQTFVDLTISPASAPK
jgi:N-acetylmuramic acid 6-phosphate etherase